MAISFNQREVLRLADKLRKMLDEIFRFGKEGLPDNNPFSGNWKRREKMEAGNASPLAHPSPA